MAQLFWSGLTYAVLAALLGLAFQLAHLPSRIFHIALAGVYLTAPYTAWQAHAWGLSAAAACLVASAIGAGLGALLGLNHERLGVGRAGAGIHLVASLAAAIVLQQAIILVYGTEPLELNFWRRASYRAFETNIPRVHVVGTAVAACLLAGTYAALRWTRRGLQLRALADNPPQFALLGHSPSRVRVLTMAYAGFLVGAASLISALDLRFDPNIGMGELLAGIVAVIVGGASSFLGPLAGGAVLGLLRITTIWFLSAAWQEAAMFALLVFFLVLRPGGILGQPIEELAE